VDIIPNPTSNYFRISCEEDEWISLKIYKTYGHKVLHFNEVKDDFVNITHIPNGVYFYSYEYKWRYNNGEDNYTTLDE